MKVDTFDRFFGNLIHTHAAEGEIAESTALGRYTRSFGVSLAIATVFNGLLVILKELDKGVLNWMKSVTPHHWITHGILDLLLFAVIGLVLAQLNGGKGVRISERSLTVAIVGGVVIGALLIAGFHLLVG